GWIEAADKQTSDFKLITVEGATVPFKLTKRSLIRDLLDWFHDESLVTIQGRALYRRNAELQELEVDNAALVEEDQGTDLPTAATMPITDQFATIAQLGAGWLDGRGDAYNADVVASIRRVLEGLVDRYALARPFVYPTPDNEVRVEWPSQI